MVATARPSYGVGSRLMTTSLAPPLTATAHNEAAGSTVRVLPIARNRLAFCAAVAARDSTATSSASPNITVADLSIPPQSVHGGSDSPARTRTNVSAISVRPPQPTQTTP